MPKNVNKKPNAKQKAFLAAYASCGNISKAATLAKVHRSQHYLWLEDAEYAADFASAHEQACDVLEMEARRRAIEGVNEPVVYQGRLTYEPLLDKHGRVKKDPETEGILYSKTPLTVRKYSDVLLIFLLKGARPDKYRDNFKGSITTGALPMSLDLSKLTDEEFEHLRSLAGKVVKSGNSGGGSPAPLTA